MSANRIHSVGPWQKDEAFAGETGIYPGMLIDINSSGKAIKHATEGGAAEMAVAMENVLGKGGSVDDVYENAELVAYGVPGKGSQFNVLLAAGENAAIGNWLVSGGDGTFVVSTNVSSGVTIATGGLLCKAMEALDLSGSGAVNTLIRVRAL